ncbi:hypothetical protein JDN40_04155 [Rhodomicrobium vannielii ATCC 17100]|uniref:hypothetical protein n=1 Tax=Rhodomicrobium vannielii TaxID=1069 RepID=UPI00191A4689|nr:hypothetical protein [Rhodomicrobium vannielii]MBJ7533300.1 hypothetical protein [Rhodomicrobium vannielii ATCC 17100]
MSDVLVEAEELLKELPDAVDRRKLGDQLRKAVIALGTADRQIARIAALLELSRIVGFGETVDQHAALEDMKECAIDIGAALEEADNEKQLRLAVYEYENSLPRALSALERAVRERWRLVALARFQSLIGIGKLLTSMNVSNNLGSRLEDCGRRGMAASSIGAAADLVTNVKGLLAELDTLQQERAAEISDDDVGIFINALAENRATLAMVNSKVHEWLKEHSALERLGISLR